MSDNSENPTRTERIDVWATVDEKELFAAICDVRNETSSDTIFTLLIDYNLRRVYSIGSLIRALDDYRTAAAAVARRTDDYGRERVIGQYEGKVIAYDYVLAELRKLIEKR